MSSFQSNPIDKENATSHLINKMSGKKTGLSSRGLKVVENNEQKIKSSENKQTRMASDKAQKRRAFGDVMNTASSQRQTASIIKNTNSNNDCCSNEKYAKKSLKTPTSQMANVNNNDEESMQSIEHTILFKYDSFDDILSSKENLSALLLNSQSIARLPTHSIGEKCNYEDHFHTKHFISDKKFRKNINKEAKRMYATSIEIYKDCNDSLDLNENLFVPPADW